MDILTYIMAKNNASSMIQSAISGLPRGIVYRGAVSYYNDLPNTAEVGDCYTIRYKDNSNESNGAEYVWGPYDGSNRWIQLGPDLSSYQETLVSGTNIKTIHGNSLLGAGNIEIPTYSPFKSTWRHDTIAHLIEDINSDNSVVVGSSYLGEITTVTTTEGLFNGNAEMVVNVMRNHLYWCIISSNNVDPYHWEATFSGAAISPKGWTPFVPGDRTIAGINLKDNITKVALQTALEDSTHRFITDSERTSWNNAATFASTPLSIANIFPLDTNAADGTYTLKAYKVNGEVTYAWHSDT